MQFSRQTVQTDSTARPYGCQTVSTVAWKSRRQQQEKFRVCIFSVGHGKQDRQFLPIEISWSEIFSVYCCNFPNNKNFSLTRFPRRLGFFLVHWTKNTVSGIYLWMWFICCSWKCYRNSSCVSILIVYEKNLICNRKTNWVGR